MRRSCRPGQSSRPARAPAPSRRPAESRPTVLFPRINFIKQSVHTPHPASARPAVPAAAALRLAPTRASPCERVRRKIYRVIAGPSIPCTQPFAVCIPTPAGKQIMMNKRKYEEEDDSDDGQPKMKRQRRRKRSRSEPLLNDTENAEKRQALKRLFGRICSFELEDNQQREEEANFSDPGLQGEYNDENDDPLLDSVPVDMDPEQLGFLVCAQETLRFLHGRGISAQHPVFARLRSRLLQGIDELATA